MSQEKTLSITVEKFTITSAYLKRDVVIDCYLPLTLNSISNGCSLLLINDGQDLPAMPFTGIIEEMYAQDALEPLFCVGIYCATDRKNEYGTARQTDYKGRGAKALLFNFFVMQELLPFLREQYHVYAFTSKSYAGFSLGGLCALDIIWNHAEEFAKVGVFSGSLWWRSKDQEDPDFDENKHRIMQQQIIKGEFRPWLKFFFQTGALDESGDRNNNGIIDSIDDTLNIIEELHTKGYTADEVAYLELEDGHHDVPTWAKAMPAFLKWGWGK